MRAMKDSGIAWIGEIPEEWQIHRIKVNFQIITGNGFSPQLQGMIGEQYPMYKASDISYSGKYIYTATNSVSERVAKEQHFNIIPSGSILFAKVGEAMKKNNRAINAIPCCIDNNCQAMVPHNINTDYGYYIFSIIDLNEFDNGGTVPCINNQKLRSYFIPYPSVNEQQHIADYLDRKCSQIDAIIARQQEVIEKLKAYKLSVITEAVTKGLNPHAPMKDSGVEWIGEIPEHWSESTILHNIRFEGGSQPPLEYFIDEPRDGYIRLIQNRDYRTDDYATYVPITMVSKFCTKEDVMIGRYGPPIFVIHRGLEGAYNVALMKAVPINLDREFMFYYLQNSTLLKYIESFSVRTAGQSGVNPNILKRYPMFVPPVAEQQQIAEGLLIKCHHIDNLIASKNNLVKQLISYKKSLIYEVVTGKKEI